MQKTTALLQILDLITKQHMCTMKSDNFDELYIWVRNFTNKSSANIVTEKETFHSEGEEDHDQELNGVADLKNAMSAPVWIIGQGNVREAIAKGTEAARARAVAREQLEVWRTPF